MRKSRAKPIIILIVAFFLVLAAGIAVGAWMKGPAPRIDQKTGMKQETITLKNVPITVDVAETELEREHGLSGREGLGENEGMLFVFQSDGMYAFWMKDMKFSIDMLWIAKNGEVVYVVPSVSPDTYPASFAPSKDARYVLELPAGWAASHGVKEGDTVSFQ